jgi:hypothetical protein
VPRAEKAGKLAKLLGKEFKKRDTANKADPARDIAELAILCLEKGLSSPNTVRSDRIFSLFKHLHAFAEDLKPYGPNSRRAGFYGSWMDHKYGSGKHSELLTKAEQIYKEIKNGSHRIVSRK